MTLSGSRDVRPPCRPPSGALPASGCRQALRRLYLWVHIAFGWFFSPLFATDVTGLGTSPWKPGSFATGEGPAQAVLWATDAGCEHGRARLPNIGIMDVGYRMHTRCACLARSSVPGIRPSASIRYRVPGARYPGPETRHPYRIPIPEGKAGIPAHALKNTPMGYA
jgi:hypothetical protein